MDKSYDYDYENENDYTWDDRYYGTGNTEPPKEHNGHMALMLILIIFLFGIITVLGVLNIKLFQELKLKRQESEISLSFTTEATVPPETMPLTVPDVIAEDAPDFNSMQLQQSPKGLYETVGESGVIMDHVRQGDMVKVTWSNGTRVYLNFGDKQAAMDDVTLDKLSYKVVNGNGN